MLEKADLLIGKAREELIQVKKDIDDNFLGS